MRHRGRQAAYRMAAAAFLLVWIAFPAAAQTDVERTVEATADGTVEILNIAGSIDLIGWDRDEVSVTGTLGRGVEELVVERRGSRVEIEAELRHGHQGRHGHASAGNASAHLEIRLPHGSEVRVETVAADVTADGLTGELEVEAVSGKVDVENGPRKLQVETVSGDVTAHSGVERISVDTVSGTIKLHAGREIEIDAVSGDIEILDVEDVESADLEVVAGSIRFAGSLAPRGRLSASSHNGSVDVTLPGSVSARFDLSTFSGRITNELGPPAKRVGRYTPEQEVEFETGSGDGRVSLESFAGSITLRKR